MKAKKRNHTLKKRMRRSIILSTIITTLIFSGILFYIASDFLKLAANYASNYLGSKIAADMSSPEFLKKYNITSPEEFSPSNRDYNAWVTSVNEIVNINPLAPPVSKLGSPAGVSMSLDSNMRKLSALAYVEVLIENKQIYSNTPENLTLSTGPVSNRIYNHFNSTSSNDIRDSNWQIAGKVVSKINPHLVLIVYLTITSLVVLAFILAFIFAILFSNFAVYPVISPISQLDKNIQLIAKEDFETTMNTKIELKKPPLEIESIINAANKIMQKLKNYNEQVKLQNQTLENQNSELESQNTELTESRRQIEEAQEKLFKREKSVRTLLNNAGQGFLSFGRDLYVDREYSSECIKIFDEKINGRYLPDIIFTSDSEGKTFFEKVLKKIFEETDQQRKNIYLPLLPEEVRINNKAVHMDYKIIGDIDNDCNIDMMLVLTDITHNKYLENQIEQERNMLKMMVKAVVNYSDFVNNINDYYDFCNSGIQEIFNSNNNIDDITSSIFREIHTFKGNFSQMYLIHVVQKLHQIESSIAEIRKNPSTASIEDFRKYIDSCKLEGLLDEDLNSLKNVLGKNFFKRDETVVIDCRNLINIEKKMLQTLTPFECRALLPEIRKLRYKKFKELLSSYDDYIQRISSNLGRLVNPLHIMDGDFLVDSSKYKGFIKSLVHIFRNIVDHAIESPDERIEKGKNETGNIICTANITDDNSLCLSIIDDGKGIDLEEIKNKAVEKGIYSKEEIKYMNDSEGLDIIFKEGFSTSRDITQFSGRGIGLSAVKNEVNKLHGIIKVKSKYGKGTEFQFLLPYEPLCGNPKITIGSIIKPLINKARQLIGEEITSVNMKTDTFLIQQAEKIKLFKYTVFVSIKGIINGKILISVNENLARAITQKFLLQTVSKEEEAELVEDALAECANIIVGNSFKLIPELEDMIVMETPITINSEDASFSFPSSRIWVVDIPFGPGKMKLSFASLDNIEE